MARLWASEHAIERFRERFCPGFSFGQARRELLVLVASARRTQNRTPDGQEFWDAGTNGEVKLIVQPRDAMRGRLPTIKTVVRAEETPEAIQGVEDDS